MQKIYTSLNDYNNVGSDLNQTIILNRYVRSLNRALLNNGKKDENNSQKLLSKIMRARL
nr:hypothetical protein [uncultured Campylobacter sp.]